MYTCAIQEIHEADVYTKVLGIEWNADEDYFRLAVGAMQKSNTLTSACNQMVCKLGVYTKGIMLCHFWKLQEILRPLNVLGWFSPSVILMKILLQ